MKRCLLPALVLLTIVASFSTSPAGDKAKKLVLPADIYKVLTERSIQAIEDTAKAGGDTAAAKIDAEGCHPRGLHARRQGPERRQGAGRCCTGGRGGSQERHQGPDHVRQVDRFRGARPVLISTSGSGRRKPFSA